MNRDQVRRAKAPIPRRTRRRLQKLLVQAAQMLDAAPVPMNCHRKMFIGNHLICECGKTHQ